MTLNRQQQGRKARTPDYRITLPGQTISPALDARLQSLTLTDQRGFESDQLDITLSDHDGRLAIPPRNAELQLEIGWRGQALVNRGTYIVNEVEHSGAPDQLTIRARAADLRAQLPGKRSQSWHQESIGDIITTIARRHSLEPSTASSLAGTLIDHIDQTEESDLHFLTRLGERFDATATIKAGRLLFLPQGTAKTASGQAIPPVTLTREDGDSHRYLINDRDAHTGVIAFWHNLETAERAQELVASDEKPKRLRDTYPTQELARQAAQSEWQRLQRAGATMSLTLAEGRPNLYPETPVRLSGWKRGIDATEWIISQVRHSMTSSEYTVGVDMEVQNNR